VCVCVSARARARVYIYIYIYIHTHTHTHRIFSNLIRTSFCRFLKRKKKLVRGSIPHLWEDDVEDKVDSEWVTDNDSVMSDDGESDE